MISIIKCETYRTHMRTAYTFHGMTKISLKPNYFVKYFRNFQNIEYKIQSILKLLFKVNKLKIII